MPDTVITTVEILEKFLKTALQLEHATIPPYLTALYSIHPQTNTAAYNILRVVAVEEMLHLTLVANLMNAIGVRPSLTYAGFVPSYPTPLPDIVKDFDVGLECFSPAAITTFLNIERTTPLPDPGTPRIRKSSKRMLGVSDTPLATCAHDPESEYVTIGAFYMEIRKGFEYLADTLGEEALFTGDRQKQFTKEYYYSGGGEVFPVTCRTSALRAIDLITEQGEGYGGGVATDEAEISHFYRFEQLLKGRYYLPNDKPGKPTGPTLDVDWTAVYPTLSNPTVDAYSGDPALEAAAAGFNQTYAAFLQVIEDSFNGTPKKLMQEAIPMMFSLRNQVNTLLRNRVPGTLADRDSAYFGRAPGEAAYAAPTFQV